MQWVSSAAITMSICWWSVFVHVFSAVLDVEDSSEVLGTLTVSVEGLEALQGIMEDKVHKWICFHWHKLMMRAASHLLTNTCYVLYIKLQLFISFQIMPTHLRLQEWESFFVLCLHITIKEIELHSFPSAKTLTVQTETSSANIFFSQKKTLRCLNTAQWSVNPYVCLQKWTERVFPSAWKNHSDQNPFRAVTVN